MQAARRLCEFFLLFHCCIQSDHSMGCRGCLCINRTRSTDYYEPLSTSHSPSPSIMDSNELILISDKSNSLIVNLSLTLDGLVVVKRKPGKSPFPLLSQSISRIDSFSSLPHFFLSPGPLHSLKLGNRTLSPPLSLLFARSQPTPLPPTRV